MVGGKDRRREREKGRKYCASYEVLSYQGLDFDWEGGRSKHSAKFCNQPEVEKGNLC